MENKPQEKPLLMTDDVTLDDIIRALAEGGIGYLALVNESNILLGIVTDADIRRAVLEKKLEFERVINRRPRVLHVSSSRKKIINHMKKHRRRYMPLVDNGGVYGGVVSLDDVEFDLMPNSVVVMAGGLGSRMGELTKHTPKPMLEVGGKPVLEHIIERFSKNGFTKFIISVNYKSEVIKNYFSDGADFGVDIDYIEEDKRMGTAGSLSLIKDNLKEPFIVVNGDVLTHLNHKKLLEWHLEQKNIATMCVREYSHQIPYGVVSFNPLCNTIEGIKEKPKFVSHVNAGIYVISPEVIKYIPEDTFYDMPTLFEDIIKGGLKTHAFVVDDYWIDIGLNEQYVKAKDDFSMQS